MSDFETAARPYAKAVFELASEQGKLQAWQDDLSLASSIAADADMQAMFAQPAMIATEKAELFISVVTGAGSKPGAEFKNFIALLAENGRLTVIPTISILFETLKQQAEGKIEVQVRSAQKMTAKQQQEISDSMAKRLGKEVKISIEIDESLIAGAVVTAGDLVIDGSASGRMANLTIALNK